LPTHHQNDEDFEEVGVVAADSHWDAVAEAEAAVVAAAESRQTADAVEGAGVVAGVDAVEGGGAVAAYAASDVGMAALFVDVVVAAAAVGTNAAWRGPACSTAAVAAAVADTPALAEFASASALAPAVVLPCANWAIELGPVDVDDAAALAFAWQ